MRCFRGHERTAAGLSVLRRVRGRGRQPRPPQDSCLVVSRLPFVSGVMKERLLGFLFCGVFVAVAVNLAADKIHAWLFADSIWFQAHWYLPFVIVPAACLLTLAAIFGFFRPGAPRWADAAVLAAI